MMVYHAFLVIVDIEPVNIVLPLSERQLFMTVIAWATAILHE